jgi:alpha-glucosidase (family GH31 glycosyl hydrolase)
MSYVPALYLPAMKTTQMLCASSLLFSLLSHAPWGTSLAHARAPREIVRRVFTAPDKYLVLELLDDDLVHFEVGHGAAPLDRPIPTSVMVSKTDYAGPTVVTVSGDAGTPLETAEVRIDVNVSSLCWKLLDKVRGVPLTEICPWHLEQPWKGLTLARGAARNVYGLGQQFVTPGLADGDWMGKRRAGGVQGNALEAFSGGAVGNTQFPIMYALAEGKQTYALFMDDVYKITWDFTADPWRLETWGEALRGYVLTGGDLPDVRRDYMELVGRPTVPPKKVFGLWLSKYGYRSWDEVRAELQALREAQFPVDGFVLDLYWFGGVADGSDGSRMGALSWDEIHFPRPAATLQALAEEEGVGIIPIEESYVTRSVPEHRALADKGYLVQLCDGGGAAAMLHSGFWDRQNPKEWWFWGRGGMLDWTNPVARSFWHTWKRQPLIDAGVTGLWTDLGEPEVFNLDGCYAGESGHARLREADVHNIFNLLWHKGIYDGYQASGSVRRPFMMTRSGAPGIQRFGAAMWSGDIGANLASLAAHHNAQMHLSLSGIDYYGADIGGFHRSGLDGALDELYTQWFASGTMLDVPPRPHTEDIWRGRTTNPAKLGDRQSNLANARLRYALSPYLYSLAHLAHRQGEPLFPPLVYYFQEDPAVREVGHEKMLGPSLLTGIVARYGEAARNVYLPRGTWIDLHTEAWIDSVGSWQYDVPTVREGRFALPLYARAGAIIPTMYVDDATMNILGKRRDGAVHDEVRVRVFADAAASAFTLFEDDGETIGYARGEVQETRITQQRGDAEARVSVEAARGDYPGAPRERAVVVELHARHLDVQAVSLDGRALPRFCDARAFEASTAAGWYRARHGVVVARSERSSVARQKDFVASARSGAAAGCEN